MGVGWWRKNSGRKSRKSCLRSRNYVTVSYMFRYHVGLMLLITWHVSLCSGNHVPNCYMFYCQLVLILLLTFNVSLCSRIMLPKVAYFPVSGYSLTVNFLVYVWSGTSSLLWHVCLCSGTNNNVKPGIASVSLHYPLKSTRTDESICEFDMIRCILNPTWQWIPHYAMTGTHLNNNLTVILQ